MAMIAMAWVANLIAPYRTVPSSLPIVHDYHGVGSKPYACRLKLWVVAIAETAETTNHMSFSNWSQSWRSDVRENVPLFDFLFSLSALNCSS